MRNYFVDVGTWIGPGNPASGCLSAFFLLILFSGCAPKRQVNPGLSNSMPTKILWAWERPEDLRFLDPKVFSIAFLTLIIFLETEMIAPKLRP